MPDRSSFDGAQEFICVRNHAASAPGSPDLIVALVGFAVAGVLLMWNTNANPAPHPDPARSV
jgi:hypothetical protein